MKMFILISATGYVLAANLGLAQGTLITRHSGSTDPLSEGFTALIYGNPSLGPITEDGRQAWSVGLNYTQIARYSRPLSLDEVAALARGWTVSATLRVADPFNSPSGAITAALYTGSRYFLLHWGALPTGDPVIVFNNSEYSLGGAGSGYHTYELRGDGATGVASLWVDGTRFLGESTGWPASSGAELAWGGTQNDSPGALANWAQISLTAVPEPSTISLVLLGTGALVCRRSWRRAAARQTSGH